MKRIYHKAKNFKEAEEWDIHQYLSMTPEERQKVSRVLRKRVYGRKILDVRESVRGK